MSQNKERDSTGNKGGPKVELVIRTIISMFLTVGTTMVMGFIVTPLEAALSPLPLIFSLGWTTIVLTIREELEFWTIVVALIGALIGRLIYRGIILMYVV